MTQTITINNRQVEYLLEGTGDPVVLSSPTWWPLDPWCLTGLPELRDDFSVLAFNHRGIGNSAATDDEYTMPLFARDTIELMDALGIEAAHIVGFANGSTIALEAARQAPDRFRGIVIAAMGSANALRDGRRFVPEGLVRSLEEQGHEAYIRHHAQDEFAFSAASRASHPERGEALADALWQHAGMPNEFIKHTMARQGHDPMDGLASLTHRVLVMCGSDDRVDRGKSTPVDVAEQAAAAIPGAELALYPGVKHMLFWEAPEAWERVKAFLKEA